MKYLADQSHIDRIAEALWRPEGGRASVMIGAGFSRNALPKLDGAAAVPNWSDIAWAMQEKLYGRVDEDCSRRRAEISADRSLALAQEYKVAFGRDGLHRF